jgi:hypothetical protein
MGYTDVVHGLGFITGAIPVLYIRVYSTRFVYLGPCSNLSAINTYPVAAL